MEQQEFCLDGRKSRSLGYSTKKGDISPNNIKIIAIYIDILYN